jgi:hypothetical protein
MTSRIHAAEDMWNKLMSGEQPSHGTNVPACCQGQTARQQKADERTRLVCEMTDAAPVQRVANVARLRQARLNKEAEDTSQAASTVRTTRCRGGSAS